jgi:diacylglycerol kinase (ATP)
LATFCPYTLYSFSELSFNIETTLDRISLAHHDLTGAAKDMGSASVFVAALFFVYVWGEFIYRHFS